MRKRIVVAAAGAQRAGDGQEAVELTFAGATYRWHLSQDEAAELRLLIHAWLEEHDESQASGRRRLILRLDGGDPMRAWVTAAQERQFRGVLRPWLARAQRHRRRVVVVQGSTPPSA